MFQTENIQLAPSKVAYCTKESSEYQIVIMKINSQEERKIIKQLVKYRSIQTRIEKIKEKMEKQLEGDSKSKKMEMYHYNRLNFNQNALY